MNVIFLHHLLKLAYIELLAVVGDNNHCYSVSGSEVVNQKVCYLLDS